MRFFGHNSGSVMLRNLAALKPFPTDIMQQVNSVKQRLSFLTHCYGSTTGRSHRNQRQLGGHSRVYAIFCPGRFSNDLLADE